MSRSEIKQPVGSLKISKDVIATIASVAALEIPGVESLVQPTGTINRFFFQSIGKKPIEVTISDDFVEIDISVNLRFGAKITQVCAAVQGNIKENVQTMTGMAVSKVNVMVEGIAFASSGEQQADEDTAQL